MTRYQYGNKKITFRLLYGGIDKDFAKIPFFGEVKNYVRSLWKGYKLWGLYKKANTPYSWHKRLFNYGKSYRTEL